MKVRFFYLRRTVSSVLLLVMLFVICFPVTAAGKYEEKDFLAIETGPFIIYYEPTVDLKKVYYRLHRRRFYISDGIRKPKKLSSFEEKIIYRMNMLFARVKETLDMHPIGITFKVKIFKDRKAVHDKYRQVTKKKTKPRAFYYHVEKTIYISEDDISDSVMAHEMAHIIIDNYFMIRPPEKVAEMLSIYADSHLDE